MYEFDIALSLMRSRKSNFLNSNVVLSVLGIIIGVTVLVFTLAVYDGYLKKLETIIFSFYPHITIQNASGLLDNKEDSNDNTIPDSLFPEDEEDQRLEICNRVCAGDIILLDEQLDEKDNSRDDNVFKLSELNSTVKKLELMKGITAVSPVILKESQFNYVYYDDNQQQVMEKNVLRVLGVQLSNTGFYVPQIERTISDITALKSLAEEDNAVIISAALYQKLFGKGLPKIGKLRQELSVQRLRDVNDSDKILDDFIQLNIVGVFHLGLQKVADNMLITRLSTAQQIFDMTGYTSMLGINLNEPMRAEFVADKIKKIMSDEKDTVVFHWQLIASKLFNSLKFYRYIIFIVLLMSLIITAFNIYNNLAIMILERKQQIGVLISMGVKKSGIYKIFFIISQFEALLGSIMGIVLGVVIGYLLNDLLNNQVSAFLPVQDASISLQFDVILYTVSPVCLMCAFIAFLQSKKALNLDVVESLQSE